MRALIAVILLLLIATVIGLGFGVIGTQSERGRAATPTIANDVIVDLGEDGEAFEVEAGTQEPGASQPMVAERDDAASEELPAEEVEKATPVAAGS
ncbi:hypothetical protein [Sphingomicrobium arenosum]|uniref:hypothetical protein n=1 Tax=Sphingomicrobium arenosum TaxID=2233861 RepID=UPI002240F6EA|nr:hypothetical protein [Sphingomicrobium arenosum]